jgi:hypothetical protein
MQGSFGAVGMDVQPHPPVYGLLFAEAIRCRRSAWGMWRTMALGLCCFAAAATGLGSACL